MIHKQKSITVNGATFEVDSKIADLLEGLNNHGYPTCLSCEDNMGGNVWINFEEEVAAQLMRDLFEYAMTQEALGEYYVLFRYIENYAAWSIHYSEETGMISDDECEGNGELEVSQSLRFRKENLPVVQAMFFKFFEDFCV